MARFCIAPEASEFTKASGINEESLCYLSKPERSQNHPLKYENWLNMLMREEGQLIVEKKIESAGFTKGLRNGF